MHVLGQGTRVHGDLGSTPSHWLFSARFKIEARCTIAPALFQHGDFEMGPRRRMRGSVAVARDALTIRSVVGSLRGASLLSLSFRALECHHEHRESPGPGRGRAFSSSSAHPSTTLSRPLRRPHPPPPLTPSPWTPPHPPLETADRCRSRVDTPREPLVRPVRRELAASPRADFKRRSAAMLGSREHRRWSTRPGSHDPTTHRRAEPLPVPPRPAPRSPHRHLAPRVDAGPGPPLRILGRVRLGDGRRRVETARTRGCAG